MFQKKPECKKFMYGVPTYVDQLGEMFHGVTVDGSTSCIPGQESIDPEECADEEGEDADGEGFVNSPMSSNTRKRASSSTSIATSPPKKSKSPMLKMFQGLLKELEITRNKEEETIAQMADKKSRQKEEKKKDIARCLDLAVECGADYNSEEYYMATKLFCSEYN